METAQLVCLGATLVCTCTYAYAYGYTCIWTQGFIQRRIHLRRLLCRYYCPDPLGFWFSFNPRWGNLWMQSFYTKNKFLTTTTFLLDLALPGVSVGSWSPDVWAWIWCWGCRLQNIHPFMGIWSVQTCICSLGSHCGRFPELGHSQTYGLWRTNHSYQWAAELLREPPPAYQGICATVGMRVPKLPALATRPAWAQGPAVQRCHFSQKSWN